MRQFVWPVRVYFEDTDSGGVVYYANYLKFMERARTEWLRSLGYEQDTLLREQGLAFVVRSVKLEYHAPARFNDLLETHTCIQRAQRASLTFAQQVLAPDQKPIMQQTILCAGLIRVACIDAITFKPKALPLGLLSEIKSGS